MAQRQQFLHELLKQDQEPFRLKTYIADRRSQLQKIAPPALHLNKRRRGALCKHACFLSFQTSPDVRKSPLFQFPSPAAKSPRNSPVFLHVPSKTAALIVEAAMRIQRQQQHRAQPRPKTVGLGLLGSFLKRLKDRSRPTKSSSAVEEERACDRRPSSANWTESKSLDFETSTSSYSSDGETRFCTSPFRFNLLKSPPTSGRRTPEFCSPATSPCRRVSQEKENYEPINSDNVREEEEEEEKEQCSPVSILDPPFDDDGHVSVDEDDGDYDLQCSYENVQRAKQQLLHRLRRFEELAELDTIKLERNSVQGSDGEEVEDSGEPILTQVLNRSSLRGHSRNMSADMKRLVCDLIVEEKSERDDSCDNEAVTRRICKRLDSWGDVELNTIDMMIGFDFKSDHDGWTGFNEQAKEGVLTEIEVAIYGLLVEELSDELLYMDTRRPIEC